MKHLKKFESSEDNITPEINEVTLTDHDIYLQGSRSCPENINQSASYEAYSEGFEACWDFIKEKLNIEGHIDSKNPVTIVVKK